MKILASQSVLLSITYWIAYTSTGTSVVMTVIRSIGNDHGGHLSRIGAWCWAQTGRTGKASICVTALILFYQHA